MRIMRMMAIGAVGFAVALCATKVAQAGKTAGSTGGGTIWFTLPGSDTFYTMSSDGSGKAPAPAWANPRVSVHGGHRWYVSWNRIGTETHPNGNWRREAFATRDDGVSVQLTNDPDLQRTGFVTNEWTPDGQRFAWIARRWVNGVVAEGGLYVVPLAFDGSGNVTGLASTPTSPALPRPLDANARPDIVDVSWAPDGSQFAYGNAAGIDIADTSGNDRQLVATKPGVAGSLLPESPSWSPAGSTILYYEAHSGTYFTMPSNGNSSTKIIRPSSSTHVSSAFWSPTGSHIVYTETSNLSLDGSPGGIYRIPSTGGSATKLTPEYALAYSAGWTP